MIARAAIAGAVLAATGAAAQTPSSPATPPPPEAAAEVAPTGTPRNLLVAPPGATDIALGDVDVPTGRFSGPWQTGSFEAYRFRRFPDATASLGADRQMAEWRIDITCDPATGACDYSVRGTPAPDATEAARRLGGWLVSLPPPPAPPEPAPEAPPEAPPAAIATLQPQEAVPPPSEEPVVETEDIDTSPAVAGPSLLPPSAAPAPDAAPPDAQPAPAPSAAPEDAPPAPPPSVPARSNAPMRAPAPAAPAATAAPAVSPAPAPVPTAPAPAASAALSEQDLCQRISGSTPMERLQRLLADEGFDPGPPDGQAGPRTAAAARAALEAPVNVTAVAQALELLYLRLCDD